MNIYKHLDDLIIFVPTRDFYIMGFRLNAKKKNKHLYQIWNFFSENFSFTIDIFNKTYNHAKRYVKWVVM